MGRKKSKKEDGRKRICVTRKSHRWISEQIGLYSLDNKPGVGGIFGCEEVELVDGNLRARVGKRKKEKKVKTERFRATARKSVNGTCPCHPERAWPPGFPIPGNDSDVSTDSRSAQESDSDDSWSGPRKKFFKDYLDKKKKKAQRRDRSWKTQNEKESSGSYDESSDEEERDTESSGDEDMAKKKGNGKDDRNGGTGSSMMAVKV